MTCDCKLSICELQKFSTPISPYKNHTIQSLYLSAMCLDWADFALYKLSFETLCYLQFFPATRFCSIFASSSSSVLSPSLLLLLTFLPLLSKTSHLSPPLPNHRLQPLLASQNGEKVHTRSPEYVVDCSSRAAPLEEAELTSEYKQHRATHRTIYYAASHIKAWCLQLCPGTILANKRLCACLITIPYTASLP